MKQKWIFVLPALWIGGIEQALVNLLGEIQEEQGGIPAWVLPELAEKLGTKESLLLALIFTVTFSLRKARA